jgi:hypothetical protein
MAVIVSIRYSIANGQPEDRKITLPDGTPYADAVKAVYHEIKAAKDNNEMIEISRFTNEIAHAPPPFSAYQSSSHYQRRHICERKRIKDNNGRLSSASFR